MKTLTAFLLMALPALAGPKDAVVELPGCSGVCVSDEGHVLTAKHCIIGSQGLPETILVEFPGADPVKAVRVWVTEDPEGPVVYDCEGDGFPFLEIADKPPSVGEQIEAWGYPGGDDLTIRKGDMTGGGDSEFLVNGRVVGRFKANYSTAVTAPGMSGGPVLDSDGKVCGLISSGNARGSTFISHFATSTARLPGAVDGELTVLYFGASWCEPCRNMHPAIESLAEDYDLTEVDVDEDKALTAEHGVRSIPAIVILYEGEEVSRVVGYTSERSLRSRLSRIERTRGEFGAGFVIQCPIPGQCPPGCRCGCQRPSTRPAPPTSIPPATAAGARGPAGPRGPAGIDGTDGADGRGIDDMRVSDGKLEVLYSDASEWVLVGELPSGPQGPAGERGPQGEPGPSRNVTVIFEDSEGNQLAPPVVVPPGANTVRVPIERFIEE